MANMPRKCPCDGLGGESQGHPGRPDLISMYVHTDWTGHMGRFHGTNGTCLQDCRNPNAEVCCQISLFVRTVRFFSSHWAKFVLFTHKF